MSPKADAYKVVTDRIIEALDAGIVPWHKPWKSVAGSGPTSMQTGREYRGINVWILSVTAMLRGYESPYWLTFKQAKERGGSVRKGEKGTQVVLWKPFKKNVKQDDGSEREESFLMLRHFVVFNLEQCDGIEAPKVEPLPERDPIEACEAIVTGYVPGPEIKHGGNSAYYSPALDYVQMPQRGQFDTSEHYYGTLFHELAHSTGHESRLKRDTLIKPNVFGSPDYSKEELVAEMTAALLCGEAGIEVNVQHHAGYIANWLEALKNDRKMLVQAAAKAQKASDLVLGVQPVKNGEEEPNGSPRSAREGRLEAAPNATVPRATISDWRRHDAIALNGSTAGGGMTPPCPRSAGGDRMSSPRGGTMPDYAAMKRELPALKSALTRAKKSGDPIKVLDAVEKAVEGFDRFGWPDAWSTWRNALDDAYYTFVRSEAGDDDRYENDGKVGARFRACADSFSW